MLEESKKSWLEKLQRDSWELELLVSGFTIFLLLGAVGYLTELHDAIDLEFGFLSATVGHYSTGALTVSCVALIINLCVHLLCRGFWIGIIGLSSVGAKTNIDELNYSPTFREKLNKQVPELNVTLKRLDDLASILFSFAYLIIFCVLSALLYMLSCYAIIMLSKWLFGSVLAGVLPMVAIYSIHYTIIGALLLFGLIYMIDFITLGSLLKRNNVVSKIYMPIYKFCSFFTLSSLYRSLYYSFINKFKKSKLSLLFYPYAIAIILIPSWYYGPSGNVNAHALFPASQEQPFYMDRDQYDDMRPDGNVIWYGSMESSVVEGEAFSFFIRYDWRDHNALQAFCGDTVFESASQPDRVNAKSVVDCLGDFYAVSIDGRKIQGLQYVFYQHPNQDEKGILTRISVEHLGNGYHELILHNRQLTGENDELKETEAAFFPFWIK